MYATKTVQILGLISRSSTSTALNEALENTKDLGNSLTSSSLQGLRVSDL